MRSPFRRLQWIVISWVNPRTYRAVIRCGGLLILAGFAIAIADARSDEPAKAAASGRAIEGVVTATGGKPLAGACPPLRVRPRDGVRGRGDGDDGRPGPLPG